MMYIHQIVFKIYGKITGPWNIGHIDLYLFWGQSLGHTDSIIPNNIVHTSNSLQDIRQNHWTMECSSQWPTLILRSNIESYWFILPNYDLHTSNSLQDVRQNHWIVKYRSGWPSLHDPPVHVTRLSHVRPTICLSWFHNRKRGKTLFKGVLDFDL